MTTYTPLQLLPLPPTAIDPRPIPTALTVDPFSDLLWVGSSSGLVTSLCSPLGLTRNVQFPAHGAKSLTGYMGHATNMSVKEIRVTDRDVWTLTDGGVGGRRRGGAVKWSVSDPMRGLTSMSPNPANSNEVVAGGNGLILANTSTGQIVRRVDLPSTVVHLASQERGIVCASMSGSVSILDHRAGLKTRIKDVQAHTGGLSGADVQTNLICTWGWTHSQGHPLPDPLVRLYDIRTLRALPPIPCPAGPTIARLHPSDSSKLVIASQQGTLQTVDMSQGSDGSTFTQLDTSSYITSMALSNHGDYLTFGDGDGQLHIWTSHDTGDHARDETGRLKLPPFHYDGGVTPEWPDQGDPQKTFTLEDRSPLNAIGMPNHREDQLLSNIPKEDYTDVTSPFFNPPEPIPNSVLSSMKMVDFIGYATMPKELRGHRNVVKAGPGAAKRMGGKYARRESAPRFRSDKDRDRANAAAELEAESTNGIPKFYKKVEIKYSKFGVEDFDFEFYNHTEYSGLETDILNSYTNSLLQALHYTTPIRAVAKAHICVDCTKENCLLCESGFLFRMLEDAKGVNCQASNFSRAFSATPQASALGLMDDKTKSTSPYGSLIQNFNRWLLSTFSAEANIEGAQVDLRPSELSGISLEVPTTVEQVVGIETVTTNTCGNCGFVTTRPATITTVDLAYPNKGSPTPSFAELLTSSIVKERLTRADCGNCKQFAPLDTKRLLAQQRLPAVLSLNALVTSGPLFEIWRDQKDQRYLPPSVKLAANADGTISEDHGVEYRIKAMVVQIQDTPDAPAHLVSFAKVDDDHWVLFNDFVVREVTEAEVFSFPDQWKTPVIIMLEQVDSDQVLRLDKLPSHINPDVLYKDVSMAWNRRNNFVKHKILTPEELPQPGTLIAIDAEFVALQQEEMEFRSDGTKSILRPSHMSLARVSVLREDEVPFVDDYILTNETVADYLTEFSGIKSGDLDRNSSAHTLVPLKVAYKKLRLLVDLGCIFIGHGLSKDFRTINIYVPPSQVLDTVNLYTSEDHKRKLSLRFLSWFLLKKDIQTASHDSIEDARYALLLYKLWEDFKRDGRLADVMDDIFFEGHKLGFKPPQDRDTTANPMSPAQQKRVPVQNGSPAPPRSRTQTAPPQRGRRK